jgi:cytochrome c-type biogenesis protein
MAKQVKAMMKPDHTQSVVLYMSKYVLFLLLGMVVASGCSTDPKPSTSTHIDPQYSGNISTLYGYGSDVVNDQMSDIIWKDSLGIQHSLLDLKGSVILLNFWTTWCSYCKEESATLNEIADSLKDEGVRVIGVSVDVGDDIFGKVRQFVSTNNMKYQIVIDPVGYTYLNYGCRSSFPWSFIIDRNGVIKYIYNGFDPSDTKRDFYEKIGSLM